MNALITVGTAAAMTAFEEYLNRRFATCAQIKVEDIEMDADNGEYIITVAPVPVPKPK